METFFNYITPIIYWVLILVWGYIFIFYIRKSKHIDSSDKFLKLLLLILAIDALRTFFESVYFGVRYTSQSGLIPIGIFNYLSQPQIVFFPKMFNLIVALLILVILIKKWLSAEINSKNKIKDLVEKQTSEIIEAKEKLEESEAKFKKLSNLTFEGIVIHDNGIVIDINLSFEKMFSYSREELLGNDIIKLLFPVKYHKTISEKIKNEYIFPYEIEGVKKDGAIFPIEIEARNFSSENKTYRVAAIRDITIRKKAEEENKKLLTAVEQSANTIIITDTKGQIEYTNPKFTEITGYTAEEVIRKTPRILKSGVQSKDFYTKLWKTITTGKIWKGEIKNKAKGGKLFWEYAIITPILNDSGEIVNYLAIKEDISERKKAELQLLEQKLLFETMFNTITDGVVITNTNREIILVNKGVKTTFGYLPEELIGKTTELLYADKTKFKIIGEKVFSDELLKTNNMYVTQYKTKNNMVFPGETFGTKLFDNQGKWIGNLRIIRDITERNNFITDIKEAKELAEEASRLKTEFLNNMSHEIRTPMNGILGFSELLNNPDLTDEKRKNFIDIIQNSGSQLMHIIDDILEISSLGTKQVKVVENPVCLNDLLLELFSIFDIKAKENKTPLYLKKGLSDEESTILTDKSKLLKILSNLLENAFKFTSKGFIEFGYCYNKDREPAELEIYIRDTGVGIKQDKHEIIFKRFSQAEKELSKKSGGLGLGLTIAKENTKLLGGKIFVESEEGKGATFFVTIPYKPVNFVTKINDQKEKTISIEGEYTILIVEDEEVNFLFLETLLNDIIKINGNILHAKDGQEAVEFCKDNQDIDYVLMDIKMPKMNGLEATKLIREFNTDIPIIAQTAYSTPEDKEKAISAGCNDFISKPITKETLNTMLNKYLFKK